MSLSIGIVGLPNVGKSTLFNALTNSAVLAANYPFATIEPNTGIVPIPDERLEVLARLYSSQKKINAAVEFVDIAGLVEGASKGEGLGNQFLANIRQCRAICHIVRAFDDPNVQHIAKTPDPKRDIEIINTELILADLNTVEKALIRLEKEARADSKLMPKLETTKALKSALDDGKPAYQLSLNPEHIAELQLLSAKPVIYLFNLDENSISDDDKKELLSKIVQPDKALFVSAKLESELLGLDDAEQKELLKAYGQVTSGLLQVVKNAFDVLGLQTFLTAGEKEVRAWTIKKGASAPEAAGVIHSDFERGFISAQIVDYNDLISAGSEQSARASGKIRTEGKAYIMRPNDVVEFRFNT